MPDLTVQNFTIQCKCELCFVIDVHGHAIFVSFEILTISGKRVPLTMYLSCAVHEQRNSIVLGY